LVVLGVICSSISYFAAAQRFEIDCSCNIIKTRSILGRKKQTTLDEITGVVTGGQIFSLIVNNKRFASISKDAVGIPQFLSWCREKSIPTFTKEQFLIQKNGNQLTKFKLYFQAQKVVFTIGYIFLFLMIFLIILLVITNPEEWTDTPLKMIIIYIGQMLMLPAIFFIIGIPISYKGIKLLKDQEKILNFNFNNEDLSNHEKWFVDTAGMKVTAFRRDYIIDIKNHNTIYKGGARPMTVVTLSVLNNDNLVIKMSLDTFFLFNRWFKKDEAENNKFKLG